MTDTIETHRLCPARWGDFEQIMGPRGGCGGCWCMLWRASKRDYEALSPERRKDAMRRLAGSDTAPGLLGYVDGVPAGWISVAPRAAFPRLESSRVLKPVDDEQVWSVSCFLVARAHRRQGLGVRLLEAACTHVREHGGQLVEGYPLAGKPDNYPVVYGWTGFERMFQRAGFVEVARRTPGRPIMRRAVG